MGSRKRKFRVRRNHDLEMIIVLVFIVAALIFGIYLLSGSDDGHHPSSDKPSRPHFDSESGK